MQTVQTEITSALKLQINSNLHRFLADDSNCCIVSIFKINLKKTLNILFKLIF